MILLIIIIVTKIPPKLYKEIHNMEVIRMNLIAPKKVEEF